MIIKIASWNMDYWKKKNKHQEAWDYLDQTIKPDIALVQEAIPTHSQYINSNPDNKKLICSNCGAEVFEKTHLLWRPIGGNRSWGSGIFSKEFPLHEIFFENSYPGCVMVGETEFPDGSFLTVISLYGLIDKNGYAITTLHRMLSDLTPLLAGESGKRKMLIGGDFNASLQCDEHYGGRSHKIFFDRLEDFGFVNCLAKFHSLPIQTLRHHQSKVPWHNDYIFANNEIADCIISCDVLDHEIIYNLSDHNPVVAVIDI